MAKLKGIVSHNGIKFVLLLLVIICSFVSTKFLTLDNALNIARQTAPLVLIAFAEGVLLINGRTDLAAGSTMCLAGLVAISVSVSTESMVLSMSAAILTAVVCSCFSSIFVAFFGLHHYIVTLAMQMAIRGVCFIYTGGTIVTQTGEQFKNLGQGHVWEIPTPILVILIAFVLFAILLSRTRLGRNFYAIGGNSEAARATGIDVRKHTIIAYVISGIFIGVAGYLFASRVNTGAPNAGIGWEGQGIASAVVGGISFGGGIGTASGALVGAFIMGIIGNILNLGAVNSYIQQIVNAGLILFAVTLDVVTKRKKLGKLRIPERLGTALK